MPVQLNISLSEGLRDKLTLHARDQNQSVASVCRRLISREVGEPVEDRWNDLEQRIKRIEDLIG